VHELRGVRPQCVEERFHVPPRESLLRNFVEQHLCRGIRLEGRAIWPIRCQRVVHVDDAYDLRQEWDRIASEATGIAASVEALVM
jgi:hypothetical protein